MSKTVVVQYKTRPNAAEENQRLVEAVYAQLASEDPGRLHYATFRLEDGDNVIGRGPRSAVLLDVDGVSRRHANLSIDVAQRVATIADLGSTNGTFVGRTPVTSPIEVHDGDAITIGSVELRLRLWGSDEGPKTKRIRRKHS